MSDILLTEQSAPSTPSAGTGLIWIDSTNILLYKGDDGITHGWSSNAAVAAVSGYAADTYVVGSNMLIPTCNLQAKTVFRWQISASKTAAGIAAPIYIVRIGTAGAIGDTARLTLTGPAQTAIADIGTLNIIVTVRTIGATGVLQGTAWWDHRGTAVSSTIGVGFANDGTGHVEGTAAGFDMTALGTGTNFVGLSVNGGTSAAWTTTQATAEATW